MRPIALGDIEYHGCPYLAANAKPDEVLSGMGSESGERRRNPNGRLKPTI